MNRHPNPRVRDEQHLIELAGIPFTEQQLAAITADLERPGAIIAGAGSGKTTVMAARVLWLVGHEGVAPERILGLTFTNKAAAELGIRIRRSLELLGPDDEERGDPVASTYHAFAGSLIAEHGLRLGIEPDLRVVTDASRFQRTARAIEAYPGQLDHAGTYLPTLIGQVVALDADLSEHLVEPGRLRTFDRDVIARYDPGAKLVAVVRDAAKTARTRTDLSRLVDAYRELKALDGVLDFSDQMAAGALLAQVPEVRTSVREQYDVVLLDEYQDTSVAQRDLLTGLFSGLPVTAVGDPAQGIYGWRGAATGNLEEFLEDFPGPAGERGRRFALSVTNRCAPTVIEAANMIAADYYATSKVVAPLTSAKPAGGRVDVALYPTVEAEVEAMVGQIAAAHAAGVPLRRIAILVRVARENGAIVAALRRAGLPFEIVGLTGLLDQPEVVDVVSVLRVVDDVTANPAVLRLLTGPRWNIGVRDLALLGRRAWQLSRVGRTDDEQETTLEAELVRAVEGTDSTEIVSLADALEDLGDLPYSPEARHRFGEVADVLRGLRRHASEPLVDLARRTVRALDLDIELEAGEVTGGADNLAVFLDAVAAYSETDRYASLAGLLAYFEAEDLHNDGMEVATPSEAESVKLLTIHRAKGLEWHTVFVPLVSKTVFPSGRGRGNWVTSTQTLPSPLRGDAGSLAQLEEWTPKAFAAFKAEKSAEAAMEERRLAYVAYTRAEEHLVVSGHWWGRTQQKPIGPSDYLLATRDWLAGRGVEPTAWADAPEDGTTNPHLANAEGIAWPATEPTLDSRRLLADRVRARLAGAEPVTSPEDDAVAARVAEIEADLELLLAEAEAAAAAERTVPLPRTLSTTSVLALTKDEPAFARSLARPMPRQPSAAARLGTRFHAWVEAHYGQQQVLLDPTDLPGRGDVDLASDAELNEVITQFRSGPYGDRTPAAIEAPFSIVLGGQQVIGRIDAVFERDGKVEVVDWKTNRAATADPLQLAVYRLAWAEMNGLDLADVTGVFYYVRLGEVQPFDDLPGRDELERLVAGESVGS